MDSEAAQRAKADRWRRLHRIHLPILRLLGFGLLSGGVFCYNRYFAEMGPAGDVLALQYLLVALAYAFAAWPLMYFGWDRVPKLDLILLVVDVPFLVGAIYASGGEHSWLVSVLLFRVADQGPYGARRALTFSLITTGAFALMVLWLAYGEGRDIHWIRESAKLVLLSAGGLYIGLTSRANDLRRKKISRVLAESRSLIDELEQARDEARAASVAKGEFLANMSHEIRTPLNAVVGVSELLLKDELTPTQRQRIEVLHHGSETLLGVLGDVLDFSKIEAGRLELGSEPFNPATPAKQCGQLFEARAEELGIELVVDVAADIPSVLGDEARIRQIMINLVSNALKFTTEGRVELRVALTAEDPIELRIEVEDTGRGIPAHRIDELFDSFTQEDTSSTRDQEGTGLGLAICRRLVDAMGGDIQVESREGEGSLFRVSLPLEPAPGQAQAKEVVEEPRFHGGGARVLLVEDNAINRFVAESLLEELGLRVTVAENGREAITIFNQSRPEIVLMDCQMPVLDGYEATREIRRSAPERRVPIIALTADAREENRRRCLEAGMDGYLSKPLRLNELAETLGRWLDSDSGPMGTP